MKDPLDVIVIGAGYSGLSCARGLHKKSARFILLEASGRVGGRTLDHVVQGGFRLELGGQYIAPVQTRVSQLVGELGLETFQAWGKGDPFLFHNGNIERYQSTPAEGIARLFQNPDIQIEIEKTLVSLETMFQEVIPSSPWESPHAESWDGMTFQSWLNQNLATQAAKDFFRFMTNQGFSTEPEQISLLQMLWFFKTSHGLPPWALGGAQANRVDGGTQLVAIKMAEPFSQQIKFHERVLKIKQEGNRVVVYTENDEFQAKCIVVCIPPQKITSIEYDPILPADLHRAFSSLLTGNAMKVQAVYEKPFWREEGFSGSGLSFNGTPTFTYDNSGPSGAPGVLLGFLTASHATKWNQCSLQERKKAVLQTWSSVFGPEAMRPLEYVEHDWMQEPSIRGGHGCHFPPGLWKELGSAFGKNQMPCFQNVIWAASDLAKDWNGYLEGALLAGEQAALEVLEILSNGKQR
jgi:monoamine oxidase